MATKAVMPGTGCAAHLLAVFLEADPCQMPSLSVTLKSVRELGLRQSLAYLGYQLGKRSGWYRLAGRPPVVTGRYAVRALGLRLPGHGPLPADDPARRQFARLQDGRVLVFGGVDLPLDFTWQHTPGHWTDYDRGQVDGRDIKFIWEPARFCWTADLARLARVADPDPLRALLASHTEAFMTHNPPYRGPQWASAQETALRLVHLAFGHAALGDCLPDFDRIIAVHALRIPLTLSYARAQDNNHLLSEAVGLYTAGVLIPDHPAADSWQKIGWRTFTRAVLRQFAPDGAYMQQSTNYHRLALTLAIWMAHLAGLAGDHFPADVRKRLGAGANWLLARCDPDTGAVPNLGPNDGAQLLPLTGLPYADFRPVVQAAARAFLGGPVLDPGPWDELGDWFEIDSAVRKFDEAGIKPGTRLSEEPPASPGRGYPGRVPPEAAESSEQTESGPGQVQAAAHHAALHHLRLPAQAFLRAVEYHNRPGHADQLHLDLWWQGINIAMDPGTYSYNADPPWQNALQTAQHHNTLTIDGLDQMTSAGRFLYVDRATGRMLEDGPARFVAQHDGYRRLGLTHRRTVEAVPAGWRVLDEILGRPGRRRIRLHWLLPDWGWSLEGSVLRLQSPQGEFSLTTRYAGPAAPEFSLARAGEALLGATPSPTRGWFSPTYALKVAALSFVVWIEVEVGAGVGIESVWEFG